MLCGYLKNLGNLIKYTYQVVHNFKRKTTVGQSLMWVILEFTGSASIFIEMIANHILYGRGKGFFTSEEFNIVKFIQGVIVLTASTTLLIQ